MNTRLIFIFFIFNLVSCRQNSETDILSSETESLDTLGDLESGLKIDSMLNEFSVNWKSDSLGLNGYRMNHYGFDKSTRTWFINGMSFKGYNKDEILTIFGRPTDSGLGKEDELFIMTYVIRQDKIEPDKKLIMYFDKDNQLDDIIEETGMKK